MKSPEIFIISILFCGGFIATGGAVNLVRNKIFPILAEFKFLLFVASESLQNWKARNVSRKRVHAVGHPELGDQESFAEQVSHHGRHKNTGEHHGRLETGHGGVSMHVGHEPLRKVRSIGGAEALWQDQRQKLAVGAYDEDDQAQDKVSVNPRGACDQEWDLRLELGLSPANRRFSLDRLESRDLRGQIEAEPHLALRRRRCLRDGQQEEELRARDFLIFRSFRLWNKGSTFSFALTLFYLGQSRRLVRLPLLLNSRVVHGSGHAWSAGRSTPCHCQSNATDPLGRI